MKVRYGYSLSSFERPDLFVISQETLDAYMELRYDKFPLLDHEEDREYPKYIEDDLDSSIFGNCHVVISEKVYNNIYTELERNRK